MEIRIYYEDTDCGGVVYYANYLRYFERARTEYLRERGVSVSDYMEQGTLFVVAHAELDYLSPGRYNEVLVISTTLTLGRASLEFAHEICEKTTGRPVVKGKAVLVCVNNAGRPVKLPPEMRESLEINK
ncbi:MAG: YbgC/FadM family acyl-CoA thioesterase [Nitrospirota bacterium]|nr:YbgC/FadM family acyl-CoA thioesterase [Nitrospirota bacterium]